MEQHHEEIIENNVNTLMESIDDVDRFIDALVEKKVFTNPEIIEKLKGIESVDDRKKTLFKKLSMRGPDAFHKLYDTYMEFGINNCADLLRPSAADKIIVTPCSRQNDFDKNKVYKMTSQPKGYMLIINIKKFKYDLEEERIGSEKDEANLSCLWEQLGYVVTVLRDLDSDAFREEIIKFRDKEEHKDVDSTVVFIMTHGDMNRANSRHIDLKARDNTVITSSWVIEQFYANNCSSLKGKPKMFFFQTCRGDKINIGIHTDGGVESIPDRADILVAYATCSGNVSLRTKFGAEFVRKICQVFQKEACETDLTTMLDEVSQIMKNTFYPEYGYQIIHIENSQFDKKLYFNPGIPAKSTSTEFDV